MQRAYGSGKSACLTLNLRCCYIRNEDLLKQASGGIAIQNNV
jgi:hypothetical protein